MDSDKPAANPPPAAWAGEKTPGGVAEPPPYQDNPYPGYPQAGYPQAGYPQAGYPQAGYPQAGYPPQGPGYQQQYGPGVYVQQTSPIGQHYNAAGPITVQPAVYVTHGPLTDPVNDYLGYSIFTMLCCCLPLGIAALIYSISAREANHSGNQVAAERSSRMARILNHVALGIGVGVIVLFIIYAAVAFSFVS